MNQHPMTTNVQRELKACPFCQAVPKEHDGDYVVSHSINCFFTQQYAQEMWLTSSRRIEAWNTRASDSLAREMRDVISDALGMFRCTQHPEDYPEDHWSNRAVSLLAQWEEKGVR